MGTMGHIIRQAPNNTPRGKTLCKTNKYKVCQKVSKCMCVCVLVFVQMNKHTNNIDGHDKLNYVGKPKKTPSTSIQKSNQSKIHTGSLSMHSSSKAVGERATLEKQV